MVKLAKPRKKEKKEKKNKKEMENQRNQQEEVVAKQTGIKTNKHIKKNSRFRNNRISVLIVPICYSFSIQSSMCLPGKFGASVWWFWSPPVWGVAAWWGRSLVGLQGGGLAGWLAAACAAFRLMFQLSLVLYLS
jgi:hypothetical protein